MTPSHALPVELTIYTVGELRPQWLHWLADLRRDALAGALNAEDLTLDAAAVGEVDAAGVQLLLSLAQALSREHGVLRLHRPSTTLTEACGVLGATALLPEPASVGDGA